MSRPLTMIETTMRAIELRRTPLGNCLKRDLGNAPSVDLAVTPGPKQAERCRFGAL
jgi:hypothetical protein